jgi:hypothetical protein
MSKRTRTTQPDAILTFLREAKADADIINHHRSSEAADLARLVCSLEREIAIEHTKLEHLEARNKAGKVDDEAVLACDLNHARLSGLHRNAMLDFDKAAAEWHKTAAVAKAASVAYYARLDGQA